MYDVKETESGDCVPSTLSQATEKRGKIITASKSHDIAVLLMVMRPPVQVFSRIIIMSYDFSVFKRNYVLFT